VVFVENLYQLKSLIQTRLEIMQSLIYHKL